MSTDDENSKSFDSNGSFSSLHMISHRVCQVLMPVTLCSIYVTLLVKLSETDAFSSESIMARTWSRLGLVTSSQDGRAVGKAMLGSLYLVLIFLALIVAITLIILFVLYMEWHSCLGYYFYMPSLLILTVITPAYIRKIGNSLGWLSLDYITLALSTWNFSAFGMMAIFGVFAYAPLIMQQLYLIHCSSMVAVLVVNILPGWAPWLLLGFLVVWDLFAVLAPFGPLNLILNLAEKSGIVDMPGLVYSTDIQPKEDNKRDDTKQQEKVNDNKEETPIKSPAHGEGNIGNPKNPDSSTENVKQVLSSPKRVDNQDERKSIEEKGLNIGLGDFIFYGLLIGVTAKGNNPSDYYTTLACFNSILIGLVATIAVLALTRRALPALPISIALGLLMAGLSIHYVPALANEFASEQIFI